jgi:hypothetical protein
MTPDRIREIREFLAKITQGKWYSDHNDKIEFVGPYLLNENMGILARFTHYGKMREDAKFVAKCPTIVSELLAEVERLQDFEIAFNHIMETKQNEKILEEIEQSGKGES